MMHVKRANRKDKGDKIYEKLMRKILKRNLKSQMLPVVFADKLFEVGRAISRIILIQENAKIDSPMWETVDTHFYYVGRCQIFHFLKLFSFTK